MIRHRVVRTEMKADPEDEANQLNELTRGAGMKWRLVAFAPVMHNWDGSITAQYVFEAVDDVN